MIEVGGLSQGIGFRPFVYGLAQRFELAGSVRNRAGAVAIEIEGAPRAIEDFVHQLRAPGARHTILRCEMTAPRGERAFRIELSDLPMAGVTPQAHVVVPSDIATCDACVAELFDASNRRAGHPFINCTQCGPRASIVRDMPYDRERTSMSGFAMCERCRREHDDPSDRRFHAQPISCHECGPKLRVLDAAGNALEVHDPVETLADAIASGQIAAVKGLGGFHLVCDASRAEVLDRLRRRKGRPSKPFALMVASVTEAERWAELDAGARAALCSPARPIVLVPKRSHDLPESVAPHVGLLGLMLPYTPLQHLLFHALHKRGCCGPLVVTSGNRSGSLIAIADREALERLSGIADLYVTHDRSIVLAYEDSVVRSELGGSGCMPLRRARGYAPLPLELPIELTEPTLAVGGHLKAVFSLACSRAPGAAHVVMSPCFGDLDGHDSYLAWWRAIGQLERVSRIEPTRIVHDLHQDYASTRYALQRCGGGDFQRIAVQHHHAHMASCMLEHGLSGDVIGVCFDGTGLGEDGTLWGGEWLVGGYRSFSRAAHLATMPLVGGDRAAREPWRIGLCYALAADTLQSVERISARIEPRALRTVRCIIERALGQESSATVALTSSIGRLFDAIAALLGLTMTTSYEGEAAMRLEALATQARGAALDESYPFVTSEGAALSIDARPIVRAIDRDLRNHEQPAVIARRFHNTIVEMIVRTCARIAARCGLTRVVLSGGVFANALITAPALEALRARGLHGYAHQSVPTNDGGLCLGQLAVAAHVGGA